MADQGAGQREQRRHGVLGRRTPPPSPRKLSSSHDIVRSTTHRTRPNRVEPRSRGGRSVPRSAPVQVAAASIVLSWAFALVITACSGSPLRSHDTWYFAPAFFAIGRARAGQLAPELRAHSCQRRFRRDQRQLHLIPPEPGFGPTASAVEQGGSDRRGSLLSGLAAGDDARSSSTIGRVTGSTRSRRCGGGVEERPLPGVLRRAAVTARQRLAVPRACLLPQPPPLAASGMQSSSNGPPWSANGAGEGRAVRVEGTPVVGRAESPSRRELVTSAAGAGHAQMPGVRVPSTGGHHKPPGNARPDSGTPRPRGLDHSPSHYPPYCHGSRRRSSQSCAS